MTNLTTAGEQQWRWDGTINRSALLLAIENPRPLNLPFSDSGCTSQRDVADPSRCRV
jgi:hypothetical protein